MRIDVISRGDGGPSADATGRATVVIAGSDDELGEPANLVREAARVIRRGKVIRQRPVVTAKKAVALLCAASLRARALGRWSRSGEYDPRPDFLHLRELAETGLGAGRGADNAIAQLRSGISTTIRILADEDRG